MAESNDSSSTAETQKSFGEPGLSTVLAREVARRRTFAIISHPDAGKTTLTEKLLLYGGAIHLAGAVKSKTKTKATTSDWMEIEKQRGISVTSSVLQFEYKGYCINLLDTPGHKDFSEDTYRTLTAADAAVMLIDAAKGVEAQTRKLFEVCRMRGIPIFTFVNKLDRPGRDPIELLDEIEKVLGIRSCPMTWPIGTGDRFKGVYDREKKEILFFQTEGQANVSGRLKPKKVGQLQELGSEFDEETLQSVELVELAGDPFDHERVLRGELTPVFFGSAMNNFGVEHFLERFIELAPPPVGRKTSDSHLAEKKLIEPTSTKFSAFFFKIQANMDPSHRDRVAFMRVCSGKFTRGMTVKHVRLGKDVKLAMPVNFFGQERTVIEEAWPGDIVGVLDTSGDLRIGDTLAQGGGFEFEGVPQFSPEHFASVTILDPMKRKQLQKGLDQLSEEGVIQVYRQRDLSDKDPVLGAVGALQFEVLKHRLLSEYSVNVNIEKLSYTCARWVEGENFDVDGCERREGNRCLVDRDANLVVLFKSDWALRWAEDNHKGFRFLKTPLARRRN
ncbi:MAG TPA: peptide chain release factor 3 [Oligoflexia bacterium]|nr:peptide chain release factor 3 [Oligoflexia bacterium]